MAGSASKQRAIIAGFTKLCLIFSKPVNASLVLLLIIVTASACAMRGFSNSFPTIFPKLISVFFPKEKKE